MEKSDPCPSARNATHSPKNLKHARIFAGFFFAFLGEQAIDAQFANIDIVCPWNLSARISTVREDQAVGGTGRIVESVRTLNFAGLSLKKPNEIEGSR